MHTLDYLQTLAVETIDKQQYIKQPLSLYEPVDYAMRQGGKRIRPLLVLLAVDMFGCELQKAQPAAVAIETLHNFTLLHDDIMDASPLRRGKPTVYKQYSTNAAILSGDTMFAMAMAKLLESEADVTSDLAKVLSQASIDVCEGQTLDMDFERQDSVTIEQYIEMVRLKTSVLLGASLKMGAIIAKANAQDIKLLEYFGENIGIAFQIQDDILDCWSDLEAFGKVTGKDIADNKKTFLYLKALEVADLKQQKQLLDLFSAKFADQNEKIRQVIAIYESLNIREIAEKVAKNYTQQAMISLEKVSVEAEAKENLTTFATRLLGRKS
ncbi:MAG: polyprenyl synthetase family protein [Bacteroidales bacterium]|jgi:geranylgeranyl diphosphate synthase type II|nr:polyprenyl synthetase family protein [Bacteroidales bacterium]